MNITLGLLAYIFATLTTDQTNVEKLVRISKLLSNFFSKKAYSNLNVKSTTKIKQNYN